jgi:two-component system, cell cycle response regulator
VSRTRARPWLVYLLAGLCLVGVYYLIPAHGVGRAVRVAVYCLVSGSAAAAVFAGVIWHRPRLRVPWLLIGASQVVYAMADATFYLSHYVFSKTNFPFISDIFYLAHYPLVVAGLVLLIRRRTPGRDLAALLDAGAVAVAAVMLSWLYMIGPLARSDMALLPKVAAVAYPVMDLTMLAVAVRLIIGSGRKPASFFLLSGNLLAIFTADTLYGMQQLSGSYHPGNYLDAIWLGGNLLLGAAALHPRMARLADRSHLRDQSFGPVRIAALFGAVLIAPGTLLIQSARNTLVDVPVIAVACALLFLLTLARMVGLIGDQRRLAVVDGLTGLYTRRFLEAQLSLEMARARRNGGTLALFIADVDHFKLINDRHGHPAGDRALTEISRRLRESTRPGDVLARYGGEEFALLAPRASQKDLSVIAERLRQQVGSVPVAVSSGTSVAITVSVGAAAYPLHASDLKELVAVADRALYAAKAAGRDRAVIGPADRPTFGAVPTEQPATAEYLCYVADEVDARLSEQEHSRVIARWARRMSVECGLDETAVRRAELAARLHDVGKIVVPDAILTKAGPLAEEEWLLLRQHPDHGYRLANLVPGLDLVAEVIRQHHEHFDGAGYPARLRGDMIRLEARILSVCDSFAAMRADRPYRGALSEDQAREELRAGRGTQFDPDLVDLFLYLHERGQVGDLDLLPPVTVPPW